MTTTFTPLRHETDRGVITGRLDEIADAAVDMVAPSSALVYHHGQDSWLRLTDPYVTHDGVYSELPLRFTRTAFRQLNERCDIPLKYADLLGEQQPSLLDINIGERANHLAQPTLFRLLRTGDHWLVRAVLSNQYRAIDNLDVLTATVRGANRSGLDLGDCQVEADWTDDRFRLRITVPAISIAAPDLLGDYRSPFPDGHGQTGTDAQGRRAGDLIWAGLEVSNSETGGGAASVAPRAVILVCTNGMTRQADIVRAVHLGGRLESGPVTWSAETQAKAVELIEAKMADAVNTFCSTEYLEGLADEMRRAKGLAVGDVTAAFEVVQQRLGFSEDETREAMNMFMRSGDATVLGVAQAVTAMAQGVEDGDRQTEIEQSFWAIVGQPETFAGAVK